MVKRAEEAIPTSIFDTEKHDREMQAQYGGGATSYKPAFLYVERGPGQGQLLEVKQGTLVIGRASVSELRLQHPSISRRHTQIRRVGEQFFVKDLGSQNGTFVNKTRIASETEAKPGDSITLGNAMLRLRGPLAKGEKLGVQTGPITDTIPQQNAPTAAARPGPSSTQKLRQETAVVARPSDGKWVKIAVFAGAVGFGLAAMLAFGIMKALSAEKAARALTHGSKTAEAPQKPVDEARESEIQAAIARKMAEQKNAPTEAARPADTDVTVVADDQASVTVKNAKPTGAPTITPVKATPVVGVKTAAVAAGNARKLTEPTDDEPVAKPGNAKRSQLLAAYEKGNAEGSLEAATTAGDKDLVKKLTTFIQAYDSANEAMMANNGSAAIKGFTKALEIDDQLSSGWGKYGAEIRKQLSNLYSLLGMQFASSGDDANASKSFLAALKYDPSNARAKAQLAKLGSGGGAQPAEGAAKPAPAKKAAPKSIDDAFGD